MSRGHTQNWPGQGLSFVTTRPPATLEGLFGQAWTEQLTDAQRREGRAPRPRGLAS